MEKLVTGPEFNTIALENQSLKGGGPKYYINIEGTEYSWPKDTITTEEIIELGGWDVSLGVIEIDKENNERTLHPGEVIQIKPGHGYSKKIRWKRGKIHTRIDQELELLRRYYPSLQYNPNGQWILIPYYPLPLGWSRETTDVAFQIHVTFPANPPYGIYVPMGIRFQNTFPKNYKEPTDVQVPFDGKWGIFSWQPDNGQWRAKGDLVSGSNLLNWVRGFAKRFQEGV